MLIRRGSAARHTTGAGRGRGRRATLAGLAIGAIALGALAFPGAANAAPTDATIEFGDGKIVANGVHVDVPVTITCDPTVALQRAVGLEIRQAATNGNIAKGETIGTVGCTGQPQTYMYRVSAEAHAFIEGAAWGAAFALTDDGEDVIFVERDDLQLSY